MATNTTLVGWTPESGGRGTWHILWLCLSTIALAVWVCYHPSAAWNGKRSWLWYNQRGLAVQGIQIFIDILCGLLLPEYYIFLGVYQLIEATSCRKKVQRLSKQKFTLREAFFITMGGYQVVIPQSYLQTADSELDEETYVLRTAHILWLLEAGVLDLPAKDHSASDDFRDEVEKAMENVSNAECESARVDSLPMVETIRPAEREPTHNTPLPAVETIGSGSAHNAYLPTAEIIEVAKRESACNIPLPIAETIKPAEHESTRNTPSLVAESLESGDLDDSEAPDSWFVTFGRIATGIGTCVGLFIGILIFMPLAFVYGIWLSKKATLQTKDDCEATSTSNTRGSPQALLTSRKVIKDKSHSDSAAKFIVVLQCIWFLVNCIGRGAHNLPLSVLEVATLAYIVFTLGAYALWWEKPQGVKVTTIFVPQLEDSQWKELAALNDAENFLTATSGPKDKTDKWLLGLFGWENVVKDIYDDTSNRSVWLVFCLACWSSAALHCIAWNAEFPTVAERTAWRVFVILLFITPLPIVADSRSLFHRRGHFTPLRFRMWLQVIGALIAGASKLSILILAFMSLRAAPAAIYDTWEIANWLLFWL